MGFNAALPWALLLLLLIPCYIWYQYRFTSRITGTRKHIAIALRSVILLLIICLIAGLQPYTSSEQRNVVAVVDRSSSAGGLEQALSFIQAFDEQDEKNQLAIMSFAKNIMIDRALQPLKDWQPLQAFHTVVDEEATNIAAALRQAGGLLNQSGGGKIVLLTDGHETAGSLVKEAQLLEAMNVIVDVVQLPGKVSKDAAISRFKVPAQLKEGEKYQLSVTVESTNQAAAELLVYEDDALIAKQAVELIEGSNTYLLDAVATSPGMRQYRAVIQMADDSETKNNTGYAFSRVDGPAGVLIVEGEKGSSQNIEAALASSYIAYRTISPVELSYELAQYVQYDAIIFNNVSAVDLPQIKMEHIESAVRNYGVGFVMLGGSDSYGVGGYFDTPVERILPVNMQLSGKKKIPDLQLMLVIDHSGSMMGNKMELAKEAAARTVELMRPVDTVGVIAFDTMAKWIVSPVKLTDKESVISSIMSIQPDGGTDIYPALAKAYDGFELDAPARKHVILLTDGISPYTPAYETLLADMKSNNITLSTVAVGQDSDINFLSSLAENGGGRSYYTEDESTLPAIFSREATLMSRAYIVEERIVPQEGYAGSWSQLWRDGLPHLDAYVATSPKSTAEIALWSPQEDPLLARWNVGAGKSVAFTSDVNGKWSSDWIAWAQFPEVFTEWVRWTYPQFVQTPYSIEQNSEGKLIVSSNDSATYSNLAMTVEAGGQTEVLPLVPTGNGQYEADASQLESGVYFTQIGEQSSAEAGGNAGASAGNDEGNGAAGAGTGVQNGITTGFIVPYSAEYQLNADQQQASQKLAALAELTGGSVLTTEAVDSVYQFAPAMQKKSYDWSRWLLMLLLALWLLDIANRRLSLPWRSWLAKLSPASKAQQTVASPAATSGEALQRLKQRKQHMAERVQRLRQEESWSQPLKAEEHARSGADARAANDRATEASRAASRASTSQQYSGSEQKHKGSERQHSGSEQQHNSSEQQQAHLQKPLSGANKQEAGGKDQAANDTMNRLLAAKNRRKQ